MTQLIEVAFRGNRKEFFQWDAETVPALKAGIIVEVDRGEDFGRVHSTGELAEIRCKGCSHGCGTTPPPRAALRLASPEETALDDTLPAENEDARRRAMERVKANNLVMKLTDAEWQWDRRKLTFYFTSERRVDFRVLVRDLAAMFRARIELKQIGVRDEAKRLSGVGRCGREYCSSSWLPELRPVNLGVAKDQKLSLNPQQISGACGRLMCCLRYEHEFYVQSRRRFPKEGRILVTAIGEEKVMSCDIFNDRVTLRSSEGDVRVVPLAELREAVGGFGESAGHERTHAALSATFVATEDDSVDDDPVELHDAPDRHDERDVYHEPDVHHEPDVYHEADVHDAQEVRTTVSATDLTDADDADDDNDDSSDAAAVEADADASTTGSESRRKRRRGRRGGRRLRAAEQRRQETDGSAADPSPATPPADDSNDTPPQR